MNIPVEAASYSFSLKSHLCRLGESSEKHIFAESYGLLLFAREFSEKAITLTTENQDVAEHIQTLIQEAIGVEVDIIQPGDGQVFHIIPENADALKKILTCFGYTGGELKIDRIRITDETNESGRAFIRGAFLTAGSMDDPERRNHLEFVIYSSLLADEFTEILKEHGLKPLRTMRSGVNIIYFRDSEQIIDLLTLMGAPDRAMELMNLKIYKEFRNNANRVTNCETANISRTVDAALGQIKAIDRLFETERFAGLPKELREIAEIRMSNPEMPLGELARLCGISRSGAAHRLNKIIKISQEKA